MGGQRAERRWATGGRWALRPRPRQFLQRRQPWPRREERNVERGGGRRKMGEGRGVAFLQTGRRCPSSCTTPQPRRNSTSTILLGYHDKSRSKAATKPLFYLQAVVRHPLYCCSISSACGQIARSSSFPAVV
uniref:Uncharacterized protein n=1 Tax=Oryza sativa subsp. japonica TaxID=39947 RepID=Q7XIW0_ORYSJ|nr:hypothetical protein [Oryza sativa Japonica Group]